ncbi:MAG: TAXI family TRAP transporter solute-binding subunit [Pseudomonadota bacterium]
MTKPAHRIHQRALRSGAAALCAILLFAGCAGGERTKTLGFTSDQPGPAIAAAVADVLGEAGIAIRIEPAFESVEELTAALEGGAVDVALLAEPIEPNHNLQLLLPMYPSILHALHRSLEEPTLDQVLGQPSIYAGPPGSVGHRLTMKLGNSFMQDNVDARLRQDEVDDDGAPHDAVLLFGGLLTYEQAERYAGYRLFSFAAPNGDAASGQAGALALRYPNLRPFTLPAGLYPGLDHDSVTTLAVETLLVGRPDLDGEWVYALIEALRESPQRFERAYPLSRATFEAPVDAVLHTLALHDGARRYVERDAPSLAERYAELIALLATLAFALATAATSWLRRRKQRRKDRLERYFRQLQDCRARLQEHPTAALYAEIDAIEDEVLGLMNAERINSDSELVAFFVFSSGLKRRRALPADDA